MAAPTVQDRVQDSVTLYTAQSALLDGAKVRLAGEATYQAGRWPSPRRVSSKAEIREKGPKTRLVVTSRTDPPLALYDWYVDRGQSENFIKDDTNALLADRLSDHRFWANQFRLLLHAGTYWLLDTLRRWLVTTAAARLQMDTLRLRLLKIGGRVWELADRSALPSPPATPASSCGPISPTASIFGESSGLNQRP
jgi:hypothetical protein